MVKSHIGPRRRLGDSILLAAQPAPGLASRFPRVPTPPPAQPLRPGAAGRLRTGSLWPRAESRAGRRGCQPRGGGVCDRAGAGEGGGDRVEREGRGEKARVAERKKKKNPWQEEKCWTTQGDVMKAADSKNGPQFQAAGRARLAAHEAIKASAAPRAGGKAAAQRFPREAGDWGPGVRGRGSGGRRGRPGKAHSLPLFITRVAPDRPD